jgi:hypothetical protein
LEVLVALACLVVVAAAAVEARPRVVSMAMAAMAEMPWSYLFTPKTEAVTLPQS